MDTIKITFNNEEHTYPKNTTYYEISKDYLNRNPILGVRINNQVFPLSKKANHDAHVEFIDVDDLIGNKMYKAGLKFIFEVALYNYDSQMEVSFLHSLPQGMLSEVKANRLLSGEDVNKLKEEMQKIIASDKKFERLNVLPSEAIRYYQNNLQFEKADNIQSINDKAVILYKLEQHLNYFYTEMPYSTKAINTFDLIYLGENRVVILFPGIGDKGLLPKYVHYENIINAFGKGRKWLEDLNVPYVTNLNKTVSQGKIKNFIESNELIFSLNIAKVAEDISKNKDLKFILIAGPSSSGKTTTTHRLAAYLQALGYDAISISTDDYYLNREDTPVDEDGKKNYETIKALDIELFNKDLTKLLNNEEVKLPTFNFITGKKEYNNDKIKVKDNTIFLIEGLHALNEELTKSIDKKYKYKIYLSPFIPINIDRHNYISTLDLRLLRRIVRDNRTRGHSVTSTIDNWQSVRKGEEEFIFPFVPEADIIINTALAYEIGVLKVYVEPLLYSVDLASPYYEEARRLISFLKQFYTIPGEYINDNSILREFIGGKNND